MQLSGMWVTKDRPRQLIRSVESLRSLCTGLLARTIVVDRSHMATRLDSSVITPNTYVLSPVETAEVFVAICADTDAEKIPEDVVRFLLTAPLGYWDTGSSRNLLLLLTRGSWVLSSDDDVDWEQIALLGDVSTPFQIVNEWEMNSFAYSSETLQSLVADSIGTRSSFVDLLRRLIDVVRTNHDSASAALIELGSYGESGYGSWLPAATWVFHQARRGITIDDSEYRNARTCSWVLRAHRSMAKTNRSSFLSMAYLLDNKGFVAPFFPFGRGDDGLWAVTRLWCDRSASVLYAPVAVRHDPPESRGFTDAHVGRGGIRYIELVQAVLESAPLVRQITDPSRRLDLLGSFIASIAAQPTGAFIESMRAFVAKSRGLRVQHLRAIAKEGAQLPLPSRWHTDLQLEIAREERLMSDPMALIPDEISAENRTLREAMEPVQESLRLYGAALTWWPQLLRIADREGRRWLDIVSSRVSATS